MGGRQGGQRDAANGLLPAKLLLATSIWKLVKQTVMTSVYGVTFVGAREQIQRAAVPIRNDKQVVTTVLQRMVLKNHSEDTPIMKQRPALGPSRRTNIHSIDSTHMMMTAIACREMGLSFAGVHDSFWTHAGTIETMNSVLRKTFWSCTAAHFWMSCWNSCRRSTRKSSSRQFPQRATSSWKEVSNAKYFFS
eukprot:jgi/Tetstr1/440083/TSEL_028441.t1